MALVSFLKTDTHGFLVFFLFAVNQLHRSSRDSVAASRAANRRDGCEAYEQQFHELDSDMHLIYQSNPTQPNP